MARKKRKYIRRKPLKHETLPIASVFVGLLPLLLMAGVVGIYLIYQYGGVLSVPTMPELSPDIEFPEITVSFHEVGHVLSETGISVLDFMITVAEGIAAGTVYFLAETVSVVDTLIRLSIDGIAALVDFLRRTIIESQIVAGAYFRAVSWTMGDFFRFLDLPTRIQAALNFILWPLHFLNPAPAVSSTNQKIGEIHQTIGHTLGPVWTIISYIWEECKRTAALLWQNIIDLFNLIGLMVEENNS